MNNHRINLLYAVGVVVVTFLLYLRVTGFDFVNYDDNNYFYENPHVTSGLSFENIRWAFEIHGPSMWVPLTWLSHQTSVSLFGTSPAPHHLINICFHALNAGLFFFLLLKLLKNRKAAMVGALLFALHPVHVESVAWVTERKDVLCGFFWLLTLLSYDRYVQKKTAPLYLIICAGTALAVMAKPLAVTLPCVMLLLDCFMYQRRRWSILLEKIPLLAIVGFASYMTMRCQLMIGAVGSAEVFPVMGRFANAIQSYGTYIIKLIVPHSLAVFYPYPEQINFAEVSFYAILLATISIAILFYVRKKPEWCLGWLWFLGVLFPMIGIVQAGSQAMADRYLYIPAMGLYLIAATLLSKTRKTIYGTGLILLLFCIINIQQTSVWENSRTLFAHAIKVTERNYLAHNNYGLTYRIEHDLEVAKKQFEASLEIRPSYFEARNNLGITLAELGDYNGAIYHLRIALAQGNQQADTLYNFGTALLNANQPEEGEKWIRLAIAKDPQNAGIHYNLGCALQKQRRWNDAQAAFEETRRLNPNHQDAQTNLEYTRQQLNRAWQVYEKGNQLRQTGAMREAEKAYLDAIHLRPNFPEACNNLGVVCGQLGDQQQALHYFTHALKLAPDYTDAQMNAEKANLLIAR